MALRLHTLNEMSHSGCFDETVHSGAILSMAAGKEPLLKPRPLRAKETL